MKQMLDRLITVVWIFSFPVISTAEGMEPDRSPVAISISPDGQFAVSANRTSDSISWIDLELNEVVQELPCPGEPVDVCWITESRFAVSLRKHDSIAIIQCQEQGLELVGLIPIGNEPGDLTCLHDERTPTLIVALTGDDSIAITKLDGDQKVETKPVGNRPRYFALSADENWLVTCCELPGEIVVHNTKTWEVVSRQEVFRNSFNLGRPMISANADFCIVPFCENREFPITRGNITRGWSINNRIVKLRLPTGPALEQRQMSLDLPGQGAADPNAVAISPDEKWLAITCGGTHELLILPLAEVPWPAGDPEDFGPHRLNEVPGLFRRIPLGGRPADLTVLNENLIAVANSLSNSIQLVNASSGEIQREIDLGGPAELSLERQGEMLFYDGTRSLHHWFSCHTCHTEGHTSGQAFDTLNDGNYDSYKLTPTLQGTAETPPWMWHGWQYDLEASIVKSMKGTLASPQPLTEHETAAMLAFLKTLKPPARPAMAISELPAILRGQDLFENRLTCTTCHQGKTLTSPATYQIGLETGNLIYPRFNPPSLRGLHTRRRYLHDGRATSLEEVLRYYHRPENVTGEALKEEDLLDLIAFLRTL